MVDTYKKNKMNCILPKIAEQIVLNRTILLKISWLHIKTSVMIKLQSTLVHWSEYLKEIAKLGTCDKVSN
jgi:hypothetical protein